MLATARRAWSKAQWTESNTATAVIHEFHAPCTPSYCRNSSVARACPLGFLRPHAHYSLVAGFPGMMSASHFITSGCRFVTCKGDNGHKALCPLSTHCFVGGGASSPEPNTVSIHAVHAWLFCTLSASAVQPPIRATDTGHKALMPCD